MIKLCVSTYADLMQKKRLSESKFYFLQSFIKTKYCNTFFELDSLQTRLYSHCKVWSSKKNTWMKNIYKKVNQERTQMGI